MDLNSVIYSDNATNIQLVVNAKDLRDFADRVIEFAMMKIKQRDEPEYYTRKEVEDLLHVSSTTLKTYRKQGCMPEPVRVKGRLLFNKAEVHKAIDEGRVKFRNYISLDL